MNDVDNDNIQEKPTITRYLKGFMRSINFDEGPKRLEIQIRENTISSGVKTFEIVFYNWNKYRFLNEIFVWNFAQNSSLFSLKAFQKECSSIQRVISVFFEAIVFHSEWLSLPVFDDHCSHC